MSESLNTDIVQVQEAEISKQKWFLFNFRHQSFKRIKEMLESSSIEYFLPSYFSVQNGPHGHKIKRERALMFNMLFLHCSLDEAVRFVSFHREINFMYRPVQHEDRSIIALNRYLDRKGESGDERMVAKYDDATFRSVVIIPDRQMEMFIKTVNAAKSASIPYVRPSEIDLEKGDKVRIVGGDYDGVEGILESTKGKDGGVVFVHIDNFIATRTAEIRPEFIQILEFAKTGKHMYKKFDSFMTRGERCVKSLLSGKGISKRDHDYFHIFTNRFSSLLTPTVNMTAKLNLYMFIAHSCIGNEVEAADYENKLYDYFPKINSDPMKAQCLTFLYACTMNPKYKDRFITLINEWRKAGTSIEKCEEMNKAFEDLNA